MIGQEGDGDAIGAGISQTKQNRKFGNLFFSFGLSLYVKLSAV
jgi:hypothetical protein